RHRQGKRVVQACTIGLSINENLKLEKGKEKSSSAARSYVQSSGHVTAVCQCRNSERAVLSAHIIAKIVIHSLFPSWIVFLIFPDLNAALVNTRFTFISIPSRKPFLSIL